MASDGDKDKLKEDFYDSFLPDGISIYLTDADGEPTSEHDEAAEDEALSAVQTITDAMADAVAAYVSSTLEANRYESHDSIVDMIADEVTEFDEEMVGSATVGSDSLNDRISRIIAIQRWTFGALSFFAQDSGTGGDYGEPWDEVAASDEISTSNGLFYNFLNKADEGRMIPLDEWELIWRAYRDHINDWPDTDI